MASSKNTKFLQPQPLRLGDKVAIVAPGKRVPISLEPALAWLTEQGWVPEVFGDPFQSETATPDSYLAGNDEERLSAFQAAIDDKSIRAILCARGGYGMSRIIDRLDFTRLMSDPIWVVGYSDITLLHLHLQQLRMESLHATMPIEYFVAGAEEARETLSNALRGNLESYQWESKEAENQSGKVAGRLLGGNLCLIAHAIGSETEPDYENTLLFLEDVGEAPYAIDRMLWQLRRAGIFKKISGLLIGDFSLTAESKEYRFGENWSDMILKHAKDFAIPVAFEFPAGHIGANTALPFGRHVELQVEGQKASLFLSSDSIPFQT